MRFILRRFVIGIAGFIGLLVYQSLRPLPIAIDVALAVGFTIEVIGLVMTSRLFASEPAKPLPSVGKMALTHLGFLAGVVVIERIFPLLQMLVPGGYTTLSGRPGSWALLIEVVAITLLGYAERKMLLGGPKTVKAAVWADTAIGAGVVPAGQPVSGPQMTQTAGTSATVGTLSPELGSSAASAGYQSVSGLFASSQQATPVAQPAAIPVAAMAAMTAPVAESSMAAPVRSAGGYASITGLVAAGPESASSTSTRGTQQMASTGDDYEGFLQHMKQGKRPFRKPGMTINEEFQAWLADRSRVANGAPEKKQSGFGKFLMGNSKA